MMTAKTNFSERRLHPRTQMHMPVQAIRLDPDAGDVVEHMEMVDISRGGMGAASSTSFYPGQRIVLTLPAPGLSVRSVCGIIRRCVKQEGRYRLGIEFERPIASLSVDGAGTRLAAVAA